MIKHLTVFLSFIVMLSLVPLCLRAKAKCSLGTYSTMVKVKNRTMKHFDINDDGCLNRYENSLFKTHERTGWKLAKKKKQKPYDVNYNLMLEPFEYKMYLKDKKDGNLKKLSKKELEKEQKIRYRLKKDE
jgi:DNA modification methylase